MKKSTVDLTVSTLKQAGVKLVVYLPDSWLHDVYQGAMHDTQFETLVATNEGEGVCICAGAWLGGLGSAMIMENSGLRAAAEPLVRLSTTSGIPVFLLMSYRGDSGDPDTWAQAHGWTMEPLLRAMNIPYRVLRREDEIASSILGGYTSSKVSKNHYALIYGSELCL